MRSRKLYVFPKTRSLIKGLVREMGTIKKKTLSKASACVSVSVMLLVAIFSILFFSSSVSTSTSTLIPEQISTEPAITILNPQSYPPIGENWTVRFNITGQANLTITPVNNTYFGVDIQFSELRCGDEVINATYTGHSAFYLYTSAGKINGADDFNGTDASLSSEFQQFRFLTNFKNLENEVLR